MKDISLTREDGRRLSLTEYGAPHGSPFFYFHGFPGSRREALLAHRCAERQNIRIVAVNRPGFGDSTFHDRRNIVDWHQDVAWVADVLKLKRFGVLGVSGGAPYALACAHCLRQRVRIVGLVCGLGPTDKTAALRSMPLVQRFGLSMVSRSPLLVALIFYPAVKLLGIRPNLFINLLARQADPTERIALKDPALQSVVTAAVSEGLRSGVRGAWTDLKLYGRPWGFRLEDIHTPVWLWHGEADPVVPVAMGRMMARSLPRCRSYIFPDEGHFSLVLNYMDTIVGTLAEANAALDT